MFTHTRKFDDRYERSEAPGDPIEISEAWRLELAPLMAGYQYDGSALRCELFNSMLEQGEKPAGEVGGLDHLIHGTHIMAMKKFFEITG